MSSKRTDGSKLPTELQILTRDEVITPLSQLQYEMAELASSFGQAIRVVPDKPPVSAEELKLAITLFEEEAAELVESLESGDLVNAAKEVIDVR